MDVLTDDEALQLAIQMSLEEAESGVSAPSKRKFDELADPQAVDREGENADPNENQKAADLKDQSSSRVKKPPSTGPAKSGLLGLDRRKMEEERLARLGLQSRSIAPISPPPSQRSREFISKKAKIDQKYDERQALGIGTATRTSFQQETPKSSAPTSALRFSNGVIKRTWAKGRSWNNDISIDELLQKDKLRKAVLSSFQWDHEWLHKKLDIYKTDLLIVVQAKTQAEQDEIIAEGVATNPRIKLCFPPMPGQVNCMHSKLMLLFYDNYMRVAIPSANLTEYDWGDDNRMENVVFVIDLPGPLEMADGDLRRLEHMTTFGQSLHYFLRKMGAPESLAKALRRYDFTATRNLAFVHTVGGSHFGEEMMCTGHLGLSQAVRQLGLATDSAVEVDFASSSLGSLTQEFLKTIYAATQGRYKNETTVRGCMKPPFPADLDKHFEDRFRIYFPTNDTVARSSGGVNAAGTICLQKRWFEGPKFPRQLMRDYISSRPGLLSHNKLMLVRGQTMSESGDYKPFAWTYVGSANLSESAWGKVIQDRSKGHPLKINCRNWECGVLLPVDVQDESTDVPSMDVFKGAFELPFEYPGPEYKGRQPWYFMDS